MITGTLKVTLRRPVEGEMGAMTDFLYVIQDGRKIGFVRKVTVGGYWEAYYRDLSHRLPTNPLGYEFARVGAWPTRKQAVEAVARSEVQVALALRLGLGVDTPCSVILDAARDAGLLSQDA